MRINIFSSYFTVLTKKNIVHGLLKHFIFSAFKQIPTQSKYIEMPQTFLRENIVANIFLFKVFFCVIYIAQRDFYPLHSADLYARIEVFL